METKDTMGMMALHHAALNGYNYTVQMLFSELLADKEAKDTTRMTALHHAASNGHDTTARILASYLDTDKEAKETTGMTALRHAASNGHASMVQMLVNDLHGDEEAKDTNEMTVLHHAVLNGHNSIVRLLARDAVEIVEVIVPTPTGNHQHGRSLIDALLRDRVHIPLHLLSKDAATYLLQNWFNELAVGNLDWLNPVTDESFSISEIVEHLLQQTHFADNNGFSIQFLDSKAEFSHLESCAHSSARKS
jgi:ankyrin repeat protein